MDRMNYRGHKGIAISVGVYFIWKQDGGYIIKIQKYLTFDHHPNLPPDGEGVAIQ